VVQPVPPQASTSTCQPSRAATTRAITGRRGVAPVPAIRLSPKKYARTDVGCAGPADAGRTDTKATINRSSKDENDPGGFMAGALSSRIP
jgi:hypothetical protein